MEDSRPVGTPIDSGAKLLKPENSSREEMEMYPFRELIGYYLIIIVSFHWLILIPKRGSFDPNLIRGIFDQSKYLRTGDVTPILIKDQIIMQVTIKIEIKIQIKVKILKLFAIPAIHQDIHLGIVTKKLILSNNYHNNHNNNFKNKNLIIRKTPMPFPKRVHKGGLKWTIECT